MAKRKRKKETKKKFMLSVEIYSIILILIGVLGICGYGPCGKLICAFFAFLFGNLYLVPLICIILIGIYLLFSKHYPDFFNSKIIGLVLAIMGLLMVFHIGYVKENTNFTDIMRRTFDEVVRVFSMVEGTSREAAIGNTGGGLLGGVLIGIFYSLFDIEGTKIIYWIFIIGGALLFTGLSIVEMLKKGYAKSKELVPHHEKKEKSDEDEHIIGVVPGEPINVKIRDNTDIKKQLIKRLLIV